MGLRSFLEKRTVYTDSPAALWERDFPSLSGMFKTAAGKRVGQDSARRMIAVYQCQSYIADGVSTLPIDLFRRVGGVRHTVPGDQTPRWLAKPNRFQTPVDFWHRVMISLLSDGNAFIYTTRKPDGRVDEMFVLHPQDVSINENDNFGVDNTYNVAGMPANSEPFNRSEILHIPAFTVGGVARGLSPIDVAREAIGLGLTMEEYGSRFFAQGTTMAGVIEHPGMPKPDEARLLREMFRKTHAGVRNSHAVGVLTGGAIFKPITITPEQAQFLDSRRFQNTQIALLYRVPAYIVDPTVTSTWGSGIEAQQSALVLDTFMPWAIRIEQSVSTFLLAGPQFIKFNFDARMRPKTKERYDAHAVAINNGFMNIDEARAIEDLPPLPKGLGKKFFRPGNHVELGAPQPKLTLDKPDPASEPASDEPVTDKKDDETDAT